MLKIYKILFNNEPVVGIRSPMDYLYIKIVRFTLKLVNSWPSKEIGETKSNIISQMSSVFLTVLTFTHLIGGILYICLRGNGLTFLDIGYGYIVTFMNFVITEVLLSTVNLDRLMNRKYLGITSYIQYSLDVSKRSPNRAIRIYYISVKGMKLDRSPKKSRLLTLMFSTKYRQLAKLFLTKMHLYYFKDNSKYAMKMHKQVHQMSHYFTLVLATQTLGGDIFFNAIPIHNYFTSGYYKNSGPTNLTYETSVYVLYPFDTYSSMEGYIFISIFNCVSSTLAAIWFCMFDLFLSILVFHVWGHFNILLHKLKHFPRPCQSLNMRASCEKYTAEELLVVANSLKNCIKYHKVIINFTNNMSDVFGTMLFVYYMFHQASGCLLLLECSQMTAGALLRYLPMSFILYQQLIQLSVIFELIGTTSEKLKQHVYGLPWELMDVKNRKTILIFLMNVQKPIHVKALGIANVGVTSMATILKTSLSYFTFLRSM